MAGDVKSAGAIKSTETVREVGGLIKWWYERTHRVKEAGGKIAWVMFGVPMDLLLAMDIVPVGTEQFASACAARQAATPYAEKGDSEGYGLDICGYQRVGLGYSAMFREQGGIPRGAPYGGLPKPDMYICRVTCEPGYKWYQAMQRYIPAPAYVYGMTLPWPETGYFLHDKSTAEQYIKYGKESLNELVAFLEQQTGKKLDLDRLRENMKITQQIRQLNHEIHAMRSRTIPCPMPTQDHMAVVFPMLSMEGTPEALDFFRRLHAEVKFRVANKIGSLPREDFRLLWTGIPLWHHMSTFSYPYKFNALFVTESVYFPPEPVELDLKDPVGDLAKREYFSCLGGLFGWQWPRRGEISYGPCSGVRFAASVLIKLIRDCHVDGVVMNSVISCRVSCVGHKHGQSILEKVLNIPTMAIETDMVDPRFFDEAGINQKLDAFMEVVRNRKEARLTGH